MSGRSRVAACLLLLALVGCAPKPVVEPAPVGAPRFPDFVVPSAPSGLATPDVLELQNRAWQRLQGGDSRAADREFAAILIVTPSFYPAEAGLGYSALTRKEAAAALAHFDKALAASPSYAPALAGRGDALLSLGRTDAALEAFQAALAADPGLTALGSRVDVLKFRHAQENIGNARKAAEAGKFEDSRREYQAAIAASPESAFLYRELAAVERKAGDMETALTHARAAVKLDPADTRALAMIAEIYESAKDWTKAADAYAALAAVDGSEITNAKIEEMRSKAAFDAMPEEFRAIDASPTITRAQLAALLAIRLDALLHRVRTSAPVLMTDTRGNWALPWIETAARAGVMEPFANHAFQPDAAVRRGDLAEAVSRVLGLIAAENPKLAARWRDPRVTFSDVAPSHLSYPAAARAVAAGVMAPMEGGSFQLTMPVSGSEAIEAVSKLEALTKR
ncbi:MAG TPA: tetratricopeptide repeat protein [Vicinamibacterales bacterium]|nr:tetratricopeptide repeat protein [Vicinamibacterales bacterium]